VHARGDFTRDASRARAGRSAFKKGSISRAVVMPRSSCDHRTLSPSGPPDGVRRCPLEGSASRPSLLATSPSESMHSWWCRRSCLLSAAVGGVQPHGSWHPSTTIWLQGFSSCSSAVVPRRWSPRRMTTSLMVGISKPGCGLPPALSFKDVHHPCWGGGCAELGPASTWVAARSLSVRGRRAFAVCGAVSCSVSGSPAWAALVPPPAPPFTAGAECGCSSTARAMVAPCTGWPHPRLLLRHQSYWEAVQDVVRCAGGGDVLGWSCPHSRGEDGSEDLFVRAGATAVRWYGTGALVVAVVGVEVVVAAGEAPHCRGGCLRRRDR
jgi:hypothetical protein